MPAKLARRGAHLRRKVAAARLTRDCPGGNAFTSCGGFGGLCMPNNLLVSIAISEVHFCYRLNHGDGQDYVQTSLLTEGPVSVIVPIDPTGVCRYVASGPTVEIEVPGVCGDAGGGGGCGEYITLAMPAWSITIGVAALQPPNPWELVLCGGVSLLCMASVACEDGCYCQQCAGQEMPQQALRYISGNLVGGDARQRCASTDPPPVNYGAVNAGPNQFPCVQYPNLSGGGQIVPTTYTSNFQNQNDTHLCGLSGAWSFSAA